VLVGPEDPADRIREWESKWILGHLCLGLSLRTFSLRVEKLVPILVELGDLTNVRFLVLRATVVGYIVQPRSARDFITRVTLLPSGQSR
jgi:hypothetical protein